MVNRKRLIKITRELIGINSENPPGDEAEIAGYVKNYLNNLGLKAKLFEFKKRRPNVVVELGRKEKKSSLLITPHLDTVPAGGNWKTSPLSAQVKENKIFGLGATDCKGNLASCLEAITSLVEDKVLLGYKLTFAATADEETGSKLGLIPLLKKGIIGPRAAVVLDSDEFDIIITQKGLVHMKVRIEGKRAHGAYPWRGVNAIDISAEIISSLINYEFHCKKDKYLKAPTINLGTIRGGDKVNIVADWCEFELDLRFLPGMRAGSLIAGIKKLIARQTKKFSVEIEGIQKPYRIEEKHPLVKQLKNAMNRKGVSPKIKGSEGATVITFFQDLGIPAVATGFGSRSTAHSVNEYVKIDNLYKGSLVLEEFLKSFKFN